MTTSTDLMLAVLSMDAYDQGYGAGIGNMPGQIDFAILLGPNDAPLPSGAFASGFYAAAYTFAGTSPVLPGQTVIAYRGTDNASLSTNDTSGGSDVIWGYSIAAGNFLSSQAEMAAQFYLAVTNSVSPDNIVLTGHSLGGGLAGFVSSIYGAPAVVFDNMPFENAAELFALAYNEGLTPSAFDGAFVQPNPSLLADLLNVVASGTVSGYSVNGNFLPGLLSSYSSPLGSVFPNPPMIGLSAYDGLGIGPVAGLSPFSQLHSINLAVMLMWDRGQNTAWHTIGPDLWAAYFNETIADALGGKGALARGGVDSGVQAMDSEIAYSATPGGSPFGDDAIQSFFVDANTIATNFQLAPPAAVGSQWALAEIAVQYAGDQAWAAGKNNGQDFNTTSGDIAVAAGEMTVGLAPSNWTSTFKATGTIVGAHDFALAALQKAIGFIGSNAVNTYFQSLLVAPSVGGFGAIDSLVNNATEILVGLQGGETLSGVGAVSSGNGSNGGAIIVSGANGTVIGSAGDDLIVGGDVVTTGNGNDVIVAQSPYATINLGAGSSDVIGYQNGDAVVFSGIRSQYEITKNAQYPGMVSIQNIATGAVDNVINVGTFEFQSQTAQGQPAGGLQAYSDDQLFHFNYVRFSSGGTELVPQGQSSGASAFIGTIAGNVDNPSDLTSTIYKLAGTDFPSDMSSTSNTEFTMTASGALSLNPGVTVDDSLWLGDINSLIQQGWSWGSGIAGVLWAPGSTSNTLTAAQQATLQNALSNGPFDVVVDALDTKTGATTEQTLVIPAVGQNSLSLTLQPTLEATTLASDYDDRQGIDLGQVTVTGDLASLTTLSLASASQAMFSFVPGAGGTGELYLNRGYDLSQLGSSLSPAVVATTPYGQTLFSFNIGIGAPLAVTLTPAPLDSELRVGAVYNRDINIGTITVTGAGAGLVNLAYDNVDFYTTALGGNQYALLLKAGHLANVTDANGRLSVLVSASTQFEPTGASTSLTIQEAAPLGIKWANGTTTISANERQAGWSAQLASTTGETSDLIWSAMPDSNPDFQISSTGLVTVTPGVTLSWQSTPTLTIDAKVTDDLGVSTSQRLTVAVNEVCPTSFDLTTRPLTQLVGSNPVVATLTGFVDPDPNDIVSLKLVSVSDPTLANRFAIDATGKNLVVVGGNPLPVENITFQLQAVNQYGEASPTESGMIGVTPSPKTAMDAAFATALMRAGAVNATSNLTTLKSEFASLGVTITALPGGADGKTFAPGTASTPTGSNEVFQPNVATSGPVDIYGSTAVDYMDANPLGADVAVQDNLHGSAAADLILGNPLDTVSYAASTAGVTIKLATKIAGTTADVAQTGGDAQGDILIGIENVVGSLTAADTFTGDASANIFTGGNAGNTFYYSAGGDTYIGGTGTNTLDLSSLSANVTATLGTGAMTVGSDATTNLVNIHVFRGTTGIDNITGSSGADVIISNGTDVVEGMGGADAIGFHTGTTVSYLHSLAGVNIAWDGYDYVGTGGDAQGDTIYDEHPYYTNFATWLTSYLTIDGSTGNDTVSVVGSTTFVGDGGSDTFKGYNTNEANNLTGIFSGTGTDTAIGGLGIDHFTNLGTGISDFNPGIDSSYDVLNFGASYGILDFTACQGSVNLNFATGVCTGTSTFTNNVAVNLNDTYTGNLAEVRTTPAGGCTIVAAGSITELQSCGTGNVLHADDNNSTLISNGVYDWLVGGAGNDRLVSGSQGGTHLNGGGGNNTLECDISSTWPVAKDTFVFNTSFGLDTVVFDSTRSNFTNVVLDFYHQSMADLSFVQQGANVMIHDTLGDVLVQNASVSYYKTSTGLAGPGLSFA